MKNPTHTAWQRLTAAARLAPRDGPVAAPFGFATRVSAQAMAARPRLPSLYELFSWRAVSMAALIAILSVAANLLPVLNSLHDDSVAVSDPVSEVLSLT